jgi:hypothetical protein
MFVSPINGHHGRVSGHRVRGHLPQALLGLCLPGLSCFAPWHQQQHHSNGLLAA